jgi:hypothetical protein
MTRAAWVFIVSLGACARTTDHHDGGGPDASATQPTLDARANDDAADARVRDAAADIAPLTP